MKAIVIENYGKNAPLVLTEQPMPSIGEHDVLVEIHAASLNPIDFKIKEGKVKFLLSYKFPLILGNDFSGVVVKVGERVKAFKPGDEVYGRPRKSRIGTLAEFIAVHEDDIWLKPQNLTFEEAASIPLVGLTTYQAFSDILHLQKGQKILIHAGSGGVGTFAIQLAKRMGAFVATTASDKGYELVKSLGADLIINYKKENFEEMLTGYDAVFDTLGGDVLEKSFRILKPGGQIVSVSGMPNARFGKEANLGWMKTAMLSIVSRKITALERKTQTKYHFLFMKASGAQWKILTEMIEAGQIKPVIDKVYQLKDTAQAFDYLESGRAKGKVIVKVK
ncbi:NADPH:quinone reductase [Brevibacillus agri]|uniref:NADP-dependent oxidoreductase n=1 Tax=Brevibacillus agri TaxID=51101 RepID=A0A3M8APM9_9BACL|nr:MULTISPECIES: NADP-dependent oxidoreductase [Brevibacillus]MDR9503128.1 NADP-dependent oxidoreductase [Brevibacillus agri]MED1643180.1 NADP-dependent oxidoreductase [Brevibacillus agri]MED1656082.1 NADP-dependent oxidoreductase [Brevibacillus agri]MED1686217.1 NADP-dependent oxidoreductase [Brevibacillus agri]MED1690354.1 NADP-dependent oxidoreductase [Brevibacillus agri]